MSGDKIRDGLLFVGVLMVALVSPIATSLLFMVISEAVFPGTGFGATGVGMLFGCGLMALIIFSYLERP